MNAMKKKALAVAISAAAGMMAGGAHATSDYTFNDACYSANTPVDDLTTCYLPEAQAGLEGDTAGEIVGAELDAAHGYAQSNFGAAWDAVHPNTATVEDPVVAELNAVPVGGANPADYNGDGEVNDADVTDFMADNDLPPSGGGNPADFNGDGNVDGDDLNAVVDLVSQAVGETVEEVSGTVEGVLPSDEPEGDAYNYEIPVEVTGTLPSADDVCTVLQGLSDTFDFTASSYSLFTGRSKWMDFRVDCGDDRSQPANVYLSTTNADPETGEGSSEILATYTPIGGDPITLPVTVKFDPAKNYNGTAIGSSDAATTVAAGVTKTLNLYAELDKDQVIDGGTIAHSGNPNVYVWLK